MNTLVVLNAGAPPYVLNDLAEAALAVCTGGRCSVLVVTPEGRSPPVLDAPVRHCRSALPPQADGGYHRNVGVQYAVTSDWSFDQVISLDSRCALLSPGLDTWAWHTLQREEIGLIGVVDPLLRVRAFEAARSAFHHVGVSGLPDQAVHGVADDVVFFSRLLATSLAEKRLLWPPASVEWPVPYGLYMALLSRCSGFAVAEWGRTDCCLPPLYVGAGDAHPPPMVLSPQFMVFSDVRQVNGYDEAMLRELLKPRHGRQTVRQIPPYAAVLAGPFDYGEATDVLEHAGSGRLG